ncbi:DUF397 domain-containing protein [Dactylosporangium sucinum]|uniref:DUF397 domain-containing protein n=1 Tax=Dactylosporangium sucinum TaxID=1424081 RepID=A0A917WUG2_9ACTN|nr:DUF397 domain-containing protein [Dactylosporangium sucinum]GGM29644.1 DUF397 domain-containing protein [Dactylosporangium sucinum]
MDDVSAWPWRKSSRSAITNDCVEVAVLPTGVAVRDSKDRRGPHVMVNAAAWDGFLAHLRAGAFDRG